jgi:hypothetical protein
MDLRRSLGSFLCACAAIFVLGGSAARAQEARAVGVTPPRLSFVDGEVSYWRPGADDWAPAQINTALGAGDSVYTGDGGNVEIEIGARAYVRAGSGTQLGVESLETGYLQFRVPAGHATVDLRRIPEGQEIEIDTPNGAFLIEHTGYYRFDVDDQATRFSVRRGGVARAVPAGGDEVEVGTNQQVLVSGTETADLERVALGGEDAWDRWNSDRTAGLSEEPRSVQYVSPNVAGADDLDRYGDWRETPTYGHVWVPRAVEADWSPYTTGRWVWDGYYGWTWVDDAPWGWAPYHYGRWCHLDGYWGWAPGPVVARPVYSPALVAFFGGGGVSVSVGVGTPFVSWVPLSWGEPVVPWWGPRGFVGRPYWGGWGGPRVVNNTVINNTTIVNVNNINRYENVRYRNAIVGIDSDRFGRGRNQFVRVDPDRVRDMRPVRGELGVRPVRESLVPREGRGVRPPDRIQNRQVVATRPPQDPARLPRSNGLIRSDDARRRPEPRIVAPHGEATNRLQRGDRNAPPPRGGMDRDVDRARSERGPSDVRERGSSDVRDRNERGGVERIPGGDRAQSSRGAPEPPGASGRASHERDRNGRDIGNDRDVGTAVERRGVDREPTPPRGGVDRAATPPRGGNDEPTRRLRNDDTPPPPRGTDRGEQPRMDHRDQGRPDRVQPSDGAGRNARIQQPEPPRTDRQQREPRNDRNDAAREVAPPRGFDGGGRGNARLEPQPRMEQPREQRRMEQPREQPQTRRSEPLREMPQSRRIEMPRAVPPSRQERSSGHDSGGPQRDSFQRQPRQEAPRPQRQEAPRVEQHGGGNPHGGGDPPRGGGDPRGGGQGGGGKHQRDH